MHTHTKKAPLSNQNTLKSYESNSLLLNSRHPSFHIATSQTR